MLYVDTRHAVSNLRRFGGMSVAGAASRNLSTAEPKDLNRLNREQGSYARKIPRLVFTWIRHAFECLKLCEMSNGRVRKLRDNDGCALPTS